MATQESTEEVETTAQRAGRRRRKYLSMYARLQIQQLLDECSTCTEVTNILRREEIETSRQTVWHLERHIEMYGSVTPLPKRGRRTKLTGGTSKRIDEAMLRDDETTAKELVAELHEAGVGISRTTALKGRRLMGWIFRGTAYCQLVRAGNREKRLRWEQENLGATFDNVIWTDETSVQMESHRRFCSRKNGSKPRYKPRPKHPAKVHVWAGISWNRATKACIFEGIMDADLYFKILEEYLVPFIESVYPQNHRFMRTTTRSTHPTVHRHSLLKKAFIGGVYHRNHQMLTQLKTFGTN